MKVFISSVTHLLKEERKALPPFLRLFDHEPLRFEDFEAQDRSSREACLAGVEAADVYILLLGPRYGTPFFPDTGLSPTAEEFRRARQRGIRILVFNKHVDEEDEPAQGDFKSEVGHYVNGRLWRSFTDPPASCNQAVGEAMKALDVERGGPIPRTTPQEPVRVPWLSEVELSDAIIPASGFVGGRNRTVSASVTAPVLELHVLGIGVTNAPVCGRSKNTLGVWHATCAPSGSCRTMIRWSSGGSPTVSGGRCVLRRNHRRVRLPSS